jgi:hypothetical protein
VLNDIVIDTNIWLHAQNPGVDRFAASLGFLEKLGLKTCTTKLCVDAGFAVANSNASRIGAEYLANLRFGSLSLNLMSALASSGRVIEVKLKMTDDERRCLKRLRVTGRDRTFVSVAMKSRDHVLASHDFLTFPAAKRTAVRRDSGVEMVDAEAARGRI